MIAIGPGSPRDPDVVALLKQSHALMESLFPPEDNFYLDIEDLCAPHIRFFVAREAGEALGTGALAIKDDYGEIKSMFVADVARGKGVGAKLLRVIEATALDEGLALLKLETGNVLHAAHRLYRRHGFSDCGPFGNYREAKSSIFMEKTLT